MLRGIYTVTQTELAWYYQFGVSEMFPDKWERFQAPIPPQERGDMIAAYRKRLTGDDPAVQIEAARAWSQWEGETITLLPDPRFSADFPPTTASRWPSRGSRTTISLTTAGSKRAKLLRDAGRLHGIPGGDRPRPLRHAMSGALRLGAA